MSDYTIDGVQSEMKFLAYKEKQKASRLQVAALYMQCLKALTSYEELGHWLTAVGDDDLIGYNAANAALMAGAEDMLAGLTVALMEHIQTMQSAMPDGYDLFPGVPRDVEDDEIIV